MSEEARHLAYRAQAKRRKAFQDALDAALTPVSNAPAEAVRAAYEPIRQFQKEGPDVGEQDKAESKQRV